MVEAGADLVQLYTGFIYEGPKLVHACAAALRDQRRQCLGLERSG